jgi:regulatory protein
MTGAHGHPEDPPGDAESVANAICLRMLASAPRTRAQLAAGLARRGIPDDAAAAVLDRLTRAGLVDDELFAEAWVDSRHHGRGLARRALAVELRRRGVAEPTVAAALDAVDDQTEVETARALVRRRLPSTRHLPTQARVRRLVGLLARKGYPPGTAFRVVRELLEQDGDPVDDDWCPDQTEDESHPDVEP